MMIAGVRLDYTKAATICGVSNTTAWRWKTGPKEIPPGYRRLLEIVVSGREIPNDWPGWRFSDGRLWSPLDRGLTAVEIEQYAWTLSLWRATLTENRQLQEYIDYLENVTPRAQVLPFPSEHTRVSATRGQELNRFFNKEEGKQS